MIAPEEKRILILVICIAILIIAYVVIAAGLIRSCPTAVPGTAQRDPPGGKDIPPPMAEETKTIAGANALFKGIPVFQQESLQSILNSFGTVEKSGQLIPADSPNKTIALLANFTSQVTNVDAPLVFRFQDTTLNNPDRWIWSFTNTSGNNTEIVFSTAQNSTLTLEAGTWLIRLTASNHYQSNTTSQFINVSYNAADRSNLTGIRFFPPDYIWNVPIDTLPIHANSSDFITSNYGASGKLHPAFGYTPLSGFDYDVVDSSLPKSDIIFRYSWMSDNARYPIPVPLRLESELTQDDCVFDCHVLIVDRDTKTLYEIFSLNGSFANGTWYAGSGAITNLSDYTLRPKGKGAADAAGLPMLQGIVRYDEVASGSVNHALRMAIPFPRYGPENYTWPARNSNSIFINNVSTNYPRLGERFRLNASVNISGYSRENQVILTALKKYGMIVADIGDNSDPRHTWQISGIRDSRWNAKDLAKLNSISGTDLEAVDESSLMINENSGQARILSVSPPTSIFTPLTR